MNILEKKRQSPVNLSSSTAIHGNFEDLDFFGYSYFNTACMDIENNGHTGIRSIITFYFYLL